MRKGPDGRTIHTTEDGTEDATRKVPRRSIRDRLLATDGDDDMPATRIATDMTTDSAPTAPGPGPSPKDRDMEMPDTVMSPTIRMPREAAPAAKPAADEAKPATPPPPPPPMPAAPAPVQANVPPPVPAAPMREAGPEAAPTQIYRPNRPVAAAAVAAPPPAAPAAAALGKAGKPIAGAPTFGRFHDRGSGGRLARHRRRARSGRVDDDRLWQ